MSEPTPSTRSSWWSTVPGLLTAGAAFLTAVTGLIAGVRQLGWFGSGSPPKPAAVARTVGPTGTSSRSSAGAPSSSQAPAGSETSAARPSSGDASTPDRVNLLAEANGGRLVLGPDDEWKATIDGEEHGSQLSYGVGKEAVYAFEGDRRATFDLFTMLIESASMANVKEFELFVGDDTPGGKFRSIGKFRPQNAKNFSVPYQEFRFDPVTARYLKVKIHSCYGVHPWVHEWQLIGRLEGS